MKRKQLPKSLFLLIAVFSISSFLFVNVHANVANAGLCCATKLEQPKMEESENGKARELPVPDMTVLGRLLELAQKFIDVAS
ncbi:MAG: hypothetical protein IPJ82_07540 [Lewinellaceae bacterium]|nr:hypothetical protein [Lewinellaceae bacterium]